VAVATVGAAVVVEEFRLLEVSVDVFDKRTTPTGEEGAPAQALSPPAERSGDSERERVLRSVPAEIWR
jgi:hypothetical protein